MIVLNIEDFSCIKRAKFELAPVTVLIGPQGSGKSVTTKLLYFFIDVLTRQYACAERGVDLDEFKRDTVRLFKNWFPVGAWGLKRFNISFVAGSFSVRVLRRMSKGSVADDVTITFSDFFKSQYLQLAEAFERARASTKADIIRRSTETSWRIRDQAGKMLGKELGESYIESQTFVPAGRAFFTSIGRLVAAIEQGSSLDPVTLRFAKLFANLRDYAARGMFMHTPADEGRDRRRSVMVELFGGEIKFERELEFVQTEDGRKVPFNALSSGQQELLPMWLLIDFFANRGVQKESGGDLFYIEEPEAHLFPAAQSKLMDFLIGQLVSRRDKRSLILTTHSPYIMAKLNNYLKAGKLGRSKRLAISVAEVVPRECWLIPKRVKAYAIESGYLKELIESDGMIDASYIDAVSDDVSRVFSALLDIEYPEESR